MYAAVCVKYFVIETIGHNSLHKKSIKEHCWRNLIVNKHKIAARIFQVFESNSHNCPINCVFLSVGNNTCLFYCIMVNYAFDRTDNTY